jgi:hypothetical protein
MGEPAGLVHVYVMYWGHAPLKKPNLPADDQATITLLVKQCYEHINAAHNSANLPFTSGHQLSTVETHSVLCKEQPA